MEPALTWKSAVGQILVGMQGESVGYGRTWRALRPTRLAVVPVGSADGFPRALGNRSRVLIGGSAVSVVGRVSMNTFMADVPEVGVGDEVVLLGRQGEAEIAAESMAAPVGIISYEILARLTAHIPRVLIDRISLHCVVSRFGRAKVWTTPYKGLMIAIPLIHGRDPGKRTTLNLPHEGQPFRPTFQSCHFSYLNCSTAPPILRTSTRRYRRVLCFENPRGSAWPERGGGGQ